ncbi:haloacid dehalogenase [Marivirga lumbricoides]|uniref:Haloacid dehalogenase n=1 Tax=Marivirga lumbricoides TaxID=1046115 RepID=A0ABQ1LB28_9BACT|nr:haloacid dehalogenase [Marivirga lumbricoides]
MEAFSKPELLIFDVNETLLDMSNVKEEINTVLQNEYAFNIWFPQLLNYAMVDTITNRYHHFGEIAEATLKMTAYSLNKKINQEELSSILKTMACLTPHPEVEEAVKKLKEAGFTLVALTNGALKVAKQQMEFAGLECYFDKVFSVEEVKAFKPSYKAYNYVLDTMKVKAKNAMLVAAHGWDIAGAKSAGLQTAFIARKGKSTYPLADDPEIKVNDLTGFADFIIN